MGAFHNLALQEDGTLWAWGNNEYGQLGTGDTQPRSQPIPVQGLSGLTLVCITLLSSLLSLYLSSCWQLYLENSVPLMVGMVGSIGHKDLMKVYLLSNGRSPKS